MTGCVSEHLGVLFTINYLFYAGVTFVPFLPVRPKPETPGDRIIRHITVVLTRFRTHLHIFLTFRASVMRVQSCFKGVLETISSQTLHGLGLRQAKMAILHIINDPEANRPGSPAS